MSKPITPPRQRWVAGCMTGTSLDGLDAALIRLQGEGLTMRLTDVTRAASRPLGEVADVAGDVAGPLRALAEQRPITAASVARLALDFGNLHAELLEELAGDRRLDLIAAHGQTVYHAPPLSVQLINPHPIAHRLRTPVVYDLRQADLAAGGQGAPITPLADFILFRDPERSRAVLNLGGFANITRLPATPPIMTNTSASGAFTAQVEMPPERLIKRISGGDICACNQLLDGVARHAMGTRYDEGGRHAAAGRIDEAAYSAAVEMLEAQAAGGRSLGTGDEAEDWVTHHRDRCTGDDLARTACAALGKVIGGHVGQSDGDSGIGGGGGVDQLVLAGGGALNPTLTGEIARHTEAEVVTADALGIPMQHREAIAMAVLGALAADGVPITLPQITGRSPHAGASGCWVYPPNES